MMANLKYWLRGLAVAALSMVVYAGALGYGFERVIGHIARIAEGKIRDGRDYRERENRKLYEGKYAAAGARRRNCRNFFCVHNRYVFIECREKSFRFQDYCGFGKKRKDGLRARKIGARAFAARPETLRNKIPQSKS